MRHRDVIRAWRANVRVMLLSHGLNGASRAVQPLVRTIADRLARGEHVDVPAVVQAFVRDVLTAADRERYLGMP